MKLLILLTFVFGCQATSKLLQEQWMAFKSNYGKQYNNHNEEQYRKKIFMQNAELVENHNKMYESGLVTYKLGINKFADMDNFEFDQTMNGYKESWDLKKSGKMFTPPENLKLPKRVDWREKGAVTGVKDQGQCGSCWAFSATGSLEGLHYLKTGRLVPLSEQQLVDCSGGKFHNGGCKGGSPDWAFMYIKENDGIDTEVSYPYTAKDGICKYDPKYKEATDMGYIYLEPENEDSLEAAVASVGPIAVAVDARWKQTQLYAGGVFTCNNTKLSLNHAVLVIGYGTDDKTGQDYWLLKNSWGTGWGEHGYFKLAKKANNSCGIGIASRYPIV